jgi:hypothetical protein
MGGDGTKHHARHFPKRRKVGKGRNLTGGLRLPHLLCCAQTLSSSFALELSTIVQIQPTTRINGVQPPHFPSPIEQRPPTGEAAAWMASDVLQRGDMVQNRSARQPAARQNHALHLIYLGQARATGILLLMSLENYDLQLHHLTPHSLVLVTTFIHLCKMYVGMRPSVRLFRLFFAL